MQTYLWECGGHGKMHACAEFNGLRFYLGSAPSYFGCLEIIAENKHRCPDAFFFGTDGDYGINGYAGDLSTEYAKAQKERST